MTAEDLQELLELVGIVDEARINPLNVVHGVIQALAFIVVKHRSASKHE